MAYFHGRSAKGKETFIEKMKRKIDSTAGRVLYSMRVAIAEPPFANICHIMGLDRFTLRAKFCVISRKKLKLFDNKAGSGKVMEPGDRSR
ncbi:MAG: hypothetical protein A2512_07300 [Deltaproteobacteria bacterium RIFOXYD12_FULL_56_24]|nr:MAG: hypothetical protein A2512_07300 [Deltaproteobacteria bacterium RIFOXYD12_FULL_56_24]